MSIFNTFFRTRGLGQLEGLNDAQLNDIGLSRDDLHQAFRMGRRAGNYLEQRRASRSII